MQCTVYERRLEGTFDEQEKKQMKIFWRYVTGFLFSMATKNPAKMSTTNTFYEMEVPPTRLLAVEGIENRQNDIIYCRKERKQPLQSVVVYFGGDTQDYPEVMESHRDNVRFVHWNLLNTAEMLSQKFPNSDVLVVKPKRMQIKTFSCYDNFIVANAMGVPDHVPNHEALHHLKALTANAATQIDKLNNQSTKNNISSGNLSECQKSENAPLVLVGFSKGCVVLNQFLYELHLTEIDVELKQFVERIKEMYWLDGGHAGGFNTWVTNKEILQKLASTGIRIHVCMTPFQLQDQRRPWLKREEKMFSESLKKMNALIQRKVLFDDQPGSIEMHFKLLEQF